MRSIASRTELLRALGPAGCPVIALLCAALLVESTAPAGTSLAVGVTVGRLQATPGGALLRAAPLPLAAFGVIALIEQLASSLITPLTLLAGNRIDVAQRARVARLAVRTRTVDVVERPEAQMLIRQALGDRSRGHDCTLSEGALGQLRWFARLCGAITSCAVLAWYAWWFVPAALIPAAVNRIVRGRQNERLMVEWRAATMREFHADVWRNAALSVGEAKEIRVFGLSGWLTRRLEQEILRANAGMWRCIDRMIASNWVQFLLAAMGLVPVYVLVALSAARGATSTTTAVAVMLAGWSLFQVFALGEESYQVKG
ncbi:MAG: ABC transporter ATP-binding protein, partial [Pseudonocardiales bacterium]|nr:ABC transporter ATP-binding protein [Pseudonocardiales bacterium]